MTYKVKCPYSHKDFIYDNLDDMRRFVVAMMLKFDCKKRVFIRRGKTIYGSMWKDGNVIRWQTKGTRTKRIVNKDGKLRM